MYFATTLPDITLRVEPFLFTLLSFLCLSCWGVVLLYYKGAGLMDRLPTVDMLDFLSYRSVMVAFPLMTVVIVTGAVWAQSAWGKWWGWDPKETASLVTWILYAVFLHMRVVAGWKGRPSAVINIIGFISVIFTYLGVNVFLSGLHSYAQSF
jgi:cytochrome c-type biogenesis protein CcsB